MDPSSSRPRLRSNASKSSSYWNGAGKPPSPTLSATTHASRPDFTDPPHLVITRADLRKSIGALQELLQSAKLLRQTLLQLSNHTSSFASALMDCSKVKGCNTQNGALMGAGGLEFLIGDGERLLADQIYRKFEIPLLETLDEYSFSVANRQAEYEKRCAEKTSAIRRKESEELRGGRRKKRDLQQFRKALGELQLQVDELDLLKCEYHREVMEAEDELWTTVTGRVGFVVKAQVDLYERVSSKSSDPSIEPLMTSNPDPFDSYATQPIGDGQIFSVLSPLGLLHTPPKAPSKSFARTPAVNNQPSGFSGDEAPDGVEAIGGVGANAVEGAVDSNTTNGPGGAGFVAQDAFSVPTPASASPDSANNVEGSAASSPRGIAFPTSGETPEEEGHLADLLYGAERRGVLSTIDDVSEVDAAGSEADSHAEIEVDGVDSEDRSADSKAGGHTLDTARQAALPRIPANPPDHAGAERPTTIEGEGTTVAA